MAVADIHPDITDLEAFALGTLDDVSLATIEAHVADCPTCQEQAVQATGDTLVELLRRAHERAALQTDTTPAPVAVEGITLALSAQANSEDTGVASVPEDLARHERYRVVRLLGAGGMGSVYEAEHLVMQRPVALKVINRAFTARPAVVERFRREVRAAARLAHPNIVTTFDAEDAGHTLFLVMEYVEGVSLARMVTERGPLPVAEACAYIRQAALGLQHAHERGMVHRDVKPDNLIRCADGTVKVLDFGLAALTTERGGGLTEENVVMGTPDYMAPEQAENASTADIRADVYSLGCTLYYLLTGSVPYPATTPVLKILAHREQPLPSLRSARPEVPPELTAVVARLLAKKPADRYQTPAEVAAALEPFTQTSKPAAKRPGSKRGWLVAAAVLFGGLIAAAGVVFYIKTDNGTIEIQTDDENVKIIAERNGKQVTVLDPKSKQTWVVDTGEWTVRLDGNPDGLKIEMPKTFTLKRGDKQVVTIKRVPGLPVEKTEAPKSDKELILGTWRGVAAEVGGQPVPQEIVDALKPTWTFTADKMTGKPEAALPKPLLEALVMKGLLPKEMAAIAEKGVEGVYSLDPSKSPKTIDITLLGQVRKTGLGLYALDGDTLKVCLSVDPERVAERPTEFATKPGAFIILVTLKRQVPEKVGELHQIRYGDLGDFKVAKKEDKEDMKPVPAPKDAIVLFDGKNLDNWTSRDGKTPEWKLLDGGIVQGDKHDIITKQKFDGTFKLHVEFRVPYLPDKTGQQRGNSGVYVQGRYEVQILDSYGLHSNYKDCGAIYNVAAPSLNACKAPTVWQSYDIEFTSPKCVDGKKTEPPVITVFHNGVKIHDKLKITSDNTFGGMGGDVCTPGPILLQFHGDPVQFRNVWLVLMK